MKSFELVAHASSNRQGPLAVLSSVDFNYLKADNYDMAQRGASSGQALLQREITPDIIERFRSHVRMDGDCWVWTGSKLKSGYGSVAMNGRTMLVHRIAYALGNGNLPPGTVVQHTCKTRSCVRPEHLTSRSQRDAIHLRLRTNQPDYVAKIRQSYQQGYEYWEIAPAFARSLTPLQVRSIALNKSWFDATYVPRKPERRKPRESSIPADLIAKLRRRHIKGSRKHGISAIARDHGVPYSVAWEAINGRSSHLRRYSPANA